MRILTLVIVSAMFVAPTIATAKPKATTPKPVSTQTTGAGKSYAACVSRGTSRGFGASEAASWCRANGYTQ